MISGAAPMHAGFCTAGTAEAPACGAQMAPADLPAGLSLCRWGQ